MENCKMVIAGFGGQGILFAGKIIAHAAMLKDKKLSWLPSYGPEMRGGTANCHVIISDENVASPIITKPDILVAMNKPSLDKFEDDVESGGYIFVDKSLIDREVRRTDVTTVYVDATKTAEKVGNIKLANMVMLGKIIKETGLFSEKEIEATFVHSLPANKQALVESNMKAVMAGFES